MLKTYRTNTPMTEAEYMWSDRRKHPRSLVRDDGTPGLTYHQAVIMADGKEQVRCAIAANNFTTTAAAVTNPASNAAVLSLHNLGASSGIASTSAYLSKTDATYATLDLLGLPTDSHRTHVELPSASLHLTFPVCDTHARHLRQNRQVCIVCGKQADAHHAEYDCPAASARTGRQVVATAYAMANLHEGRSPYQPPAMVHEALQSPLLTLRGRNAHHRLGTMPIERLQILLGWYPPTETSTTEEILGDTFEWARLSAAQPTAVAALPADFLLHVASYYQLQLQVGATPTTLLPRHGSSTIWRATMVRGHGDIPTPLRENITTDGAITAADATRPWKAPALCMALLPSGGLPNTELSLTDLELLHQRARATAQAGLRQSS